MVYAISCQDLPFPPKKTSTTSRSWHDKAKKICNTATVPSQICDGIVAVLQIQKLLFYSTCDDTVAVLQIQKLLFYSTYNFCTVSYPLSTVSFSLFRIYYFILMYRYIILGKGHSLIIHIKKVFMENEKKVINILTIFSFLIKVVSKLS